MHQTIDDNQGLRVRGNGILAVVLFYDQFISLFCFVEQYNLANANQVAKG